MAVDESGMFFAIAGRMGVAHYSLLSRRWKLFGNESQVRIVIFSCLNHVFVKKGLLGLFRNNHFQNVFLVYLRSKVFTVVAAFFGGRNFW